MNENNRRQLFDRLDAQLLDPAQSRARRYFEDTKSLLPQQGDFDYGNDRSGMNDAKPLAAMILLPFLAPAALATKVIDAGRYVRRKARFRKDTRHIAALVAMLETVHRERHEVEQQAHYRRAADAAALLDAPDEVAYLWNEAERALLVRYSVSAPLAWQRNRTFEGLALVALRGEAFRTIIAVWDDNAAKTADKFMTALSDRLTRCLPCLFTSETWSWRRGRYETLNRNS